MSRTYRKAVGKPIQGSNCSHYPRDRLDSRSGATRKITGDGFGVVRMLTETSQAEIVSLLIDQPEIKETGFNFRPPLHVTLVPFINMPRGELAAFEAGLGIGRIAQRLEASSSAPRKSLTVSLGEITAGNSVIFSRLEDPLILTERELIVAQLALHGISTARAGGRLQNPHLTIGYASRWPETAAVSVTDILGTTEIELNPWSLYEHPYDE